MTRITAPWLDDPALQAVFDLFEAAGHQVFVVGGCLRNTLLDHPVSDIDMATDARPEHVLALAEHAGIKAVPTGFDHGTVTLVVQPARFEVTTFRDDVETDGRRAVVRFSEDLETDARRRDFTMNALYADRRGQVRDPVGGMADIAARRVRFIGDAAARLQEDYLRALRYFRFLAWYGDPESGTDPEALAAIAVHLDGLTRLSRERITAEMLKLLAAADPGPALASMQHVGIVRTLFAGADAGSVPRLVHAEHVLSLGIDPILRLAALALPDPGLSLRLSRAQATQLQALAKGCADMSGPAALGYRLGREQALQVLALRSALFETPPDPSKTAEVLRGEAATFPVSARDLLPEFEGAALGEKLRQLEADWIASDFTLSRAALLGPN